MKRMSGLLLLFLSIAAAASAAAPVQVTLVRWPYT